MFHFNLLVQCAFVAIGCQLQCCFLQSRTTQFLTYWNSLVWLIHSVLNSRYRRYDEYQRWDVNKGLLNISDIHRTRQNPRPKRHELHSPDQGHSGSTVVTTVFSRDRKWTRLTKCMHSWVLPPWIRRCTCLLMHTVMLCCLVSFQS